MRRTRKVNDIDITVAKNIKAVMKEQRITQQELADNLGMTHQQVFKYICYVNRISSGTLGEIAIILGKPVNIFYEKDTTDVPMVTVAADEYHRVMDENKRLKKLCTAAINYIDVCPCDPDIHQEQWEAWEKYQATLQKEAA